LGARDGEDRGVLREANVEPDDRRRRDRREHVDEDGVNFGGGQERAGVLDPLVEVQASEDVLRQGALLLGEPRGRDPGGALAAGGEVPVGLALGETADFPGSILAKLRLKPTSGMHGRDS
jgi:hypothetical protein